MIQIHGLKLKAPVKGDVAELLLAKAAAKLRVPQSSLESLTIVRESVDAREKPAVYKVYSVALGCAKGDAWLASACKKAGLSFAAYEPESFDVKPLESIPGGPRPVVAGFGPCGIFAALVLAKMGLKPVVLERGESMDRRVAAVESFWAGGKLDPENNVQFGEGGAGTFSDGKLTTGTKSPWTHWILQTFADAGADPAILYMHKPHVGTDVIRKAVVKIRKQIEDLGGEVRFGCRLDGIDISDGRVDSTDISGGRVDSTDISDCRVGSTDISGCRVAAVRFTQRGKAEQQVLPCSAVILAIGHSARDTMRSLLDGGVYMEQKPFSMGYRIEHPQRLIDMAQYGAPHEELGLGPADYKLNVRTPSGRGVYTFCMCPGGVVVNSSSEDGAIVTNGMSYSRRDSGVANSAVLADVTPADFDPRYLPEGTDPADPLAGAALQKKYEKLASQLGGGNGFAPSQTVAEFLGAAEPCRQGSAQTAGTTADPADNKADQVAAPAAEKNTAFAASPAENRAAPAAEKNTAFAASPAENRADPAAEKNTEFAASPAENKADSAAKLTSSFLPGTTDADLAACLPDFAVQAIKEALPMLGKKLKGFDSPDAVLTGIESRSSSPVRIKRDPQSLCGLSGADLTQIPGLYPAGEGAGYAGGIMSAAADGIRTALAAAKALTEHR